MHDTPGFGVAVVHHIGDVAEPCPAKRSPRRRVRQTGAGRHCGEPLAHDHLWTNVEIISVPSPRPRRFADQVVDAREPAQVDPDAGPRIGFAVAACLVGRCPPLDPPNRTAVEEPELVGGVVGVSVLASNSLPGGVFTFPPLDDTGFVEPARQQRQVLRPEAAGR